MSSTALPSSQPPFIPVRFVDRPGSKAATSDERATVRLSFIAVHESLGGLKDDILKGAPDDLSAELLQQFAQTVVRVIDLV